MPSDASETPYVIMKTPDTSSTRNTKSGRRYSSALGRGYAGPKHSSNRTTPLAETQLGTAQHHPSTILQPANVKPSTPANNSKTPDQSLDPFSLISTTPPESRRCQQTRSPPEDTTTHIPTNSVSRSCRTIGAPASVRNTNNPARRRDFGFEPGTVC